MVLDVLIVHFGSASWGKTHSLIDNQMKWLYDNRQYYEHGDFRVL